MLPFSTSTCQTKKMVVSPDNISYNKDLLCLVLHPCSRPFVIYVCISRTSVPRCSVAFCFCWSITCLPLRLLAHIAWHTHNLSKSWLSRRVPIKDHTCVSCHTLLSLCVRQAILMWTMLHGGQFSRALMGTLEGFGRVHKQATLEHDLSPSTCQTKKWLQCPRNRCL